MVVLKVETDIITSTLQFTAASLSCDSGNNAFQNLQN